MIHLGDITKISGYEVPIVDCAIGGSPCQELSIAGKREGLAGERSGLFMEQIRTIKEMREADAKRNRANGRADLPVRPRYMVWENVPGAFSSNGGKDFAAVLEETIRIAEPEAPDLPVPPKGWSNAGAIVGDGWSIAWRTHDAQHWGVPQRRKRISLVADFGGKSAPEILFECKSMSRNPQSCGEEGKGTSETAERSIGNAISFQERGGKPGGGKGILIQDEHVGALRGVNNQAVFNIGAYDSNAWKSGNPHSGVYETEVSKTLDALNCGYPACNQGGMAVVQGFDGYNQSATGDVAMPLRNKAADSDHIPIVYAVENHPQDSRVKLSDKDVCQTLNQKMGTGGGNVPMVMAIDRAFFNAGKNALYSPQVYEDGTNPTIVSRGPSAVCIGNGQVDQLGMSEKVGALNCMHDQQAVMQKQSVRRLTPLECERLQGFPDGWTDIGEWTDSKGKKHKCSDSARYKALGNSIALPFWRFLCKRISAQYARKATMASLFDGIGGFPLAWEEANGKGSAIWASEKEEFPMAVTKYHFGEE